MKITRFAVSLLLAALLFMGLTGCHGSRGMEAFVLPKEFDTTQTYTITFWAKNDTNRTQTQIYEKAIADFETLYPNITVTLRLYTDYGKIYNDVITNISTGNDAKRLHHLPRPHCHLPDRHQHCRSAGCTFCR